MSQGLENKDPEFEKYLQGKTGLSRAYADLPAVELPGHLDAAILAEAHRAVGSRPGAKPGRRWVIPLSMVATLFVVVMVGLQLPYMLKDAALTQAPQEQRVAALDTSEAKPAAVATDERSNIQSMNRAKSAGVSAERAALEDKAYVPAQPGMPVPAARSAQEPVAVPQSPPLAQSSREGRALMAAPSPAPAGAAQRPGESAGREQNEMARGESEQGALAKEKKATGRAEASAADAFQQVAPAAARMAQPGKQEENLSLQDQASVANKPMEDWLARIKLLQQQGRLDEARKELAAFRKRYPDYPVPRTLELR